MPPPRIAYREQKPPTPERLASELGRFAVTRKTEDLGAFRTPGLRNVALTAPYMHDGSLKTLREVVLHYVRGGFSPGDRERNKHMDRTINFLELSKDQIDELVEFLKALTSPGVRGAPSLD
jgi:cytochrome c peroxidase